MSKIKIDGISHGTIEKINLLKIDSLTIKSKEFRVISFTIFNGEHILKSLGNSVTKEMKDLIENAGLEDFILFDNIKIVTKSGKIMRHASLQLKIK